jgi:hypothetical protein
VTVPTKTAAALDTMRSHNPAFADLSPSVDGDLGSGRLSSGPSSPRDEALLDSPRESLPDAADEADDGAHQTAPSGPAGLARQGAEPAPSERASSANASACLSDDEILQYRHGQASAAQLHRIDVHLDRCVQCQQLVDIIIRDELELDASPSQITTFHQGFVIAERYRIERFIGRGGMGEVYSALDDLTGKRVALKTVLCTAADDPRAIRKLFGEVLNAQRVSHPHVFKIYDLHEHFDENRGRVPFFTMEYIEGESLGLRLRRKGALRMAEARPLAEQLLAGLAAAHAKGVLHLDFKSDNVLLRESALGPEAVIMDFGLSRMADVDSRQRTSERLQGVGTLPYMSIEQLECRANLGPAADVYAFGVVLYEMLTGQLPFRADSLSALLLKQLTDRPVPPTRLVPSLSANLEAFVLRCLSRQAAGRYENAAHALAALQSISQWERPSRRRPLWAWAPFGVALLIAVAACVRWRVGSPERQISALPLEGVAALEPAIPTQAPLPTGEAEPARPFIPESRPTTTEPLPLTEPPKDTPLAPAHSAPQGPRQHGGSTQKAARAVVAAPAEGQALRAEPAPPRDWHGPPPRAVPNPLPL